MNQPWRVSIRPNQSQNETKSGLRRVASELTIARKALKMSDCGVGLAAGVGVGQTFLSAGAFLAGRNACSTQLIARSLKERVC
jgi:hypothetical protein